MLKRLGDDPRLGPKGPISRTTTITPAQAAVLDLIRRSDPVALTIGEIARWVDQHPNTTREHVEALVDAGLVAPAAVRKGVRGRPSQEYAVVEDSAPSMSLRLIEALAGHATHSGVDAQVAVELGFAAGASTSDAPAGAGETGLLPYLDAVLTGWGFSTASGEGHAGLALVRCPLVDAARSAPAIVCGFHRGVVRGLAARAGADPDDVTLIEFDRPGSCRLTVTGASGVNSALSG